MPYRQKDEEQTMTTKRIGFIGLGLIGGSIAKAIRQYYPDYELLAFDKNKETLALAVQEGTIHTACTSIDDHFQNCAYIFLCAPIAYNTAYLSQLKPYITGDCILTGVSKHPSMKKSSHLKWKSISSADIRWPVRKKAVLSTQKHI